MTSDPQEHPSHFITWPEGSNIEDPEVRFVREVNGVSAKWVEVERIPHPSDFEELPGQIEIVFRPPD
jgi:hypothetical protein